MMPKDSQLVNSLLKVFTEYEEAWDVKLQDKDERIKQLEQQVSQLGLSHPANLEPTQSARGVVPILRPVWCDIRQSEFSVVLHPSPRSG